MLQTFIVNLAPFSTRDKPKANETVSIYGVDGVLTMNLLSFYQSLVYIGCAKSYSEHLEGNPSFYDRFSALRLVQSLVIQGHVNHIWQVLEKHTWKLTLNIDVCL